MNSRFVARGFILLLLIFLVPHVFAADGRPLFPILEETNGQGSGVSATRSGDSITGKTGAVSFRTIRTTQPTAGADATTQIPIITNYGLAVVAQAPAVLVEWGKMFSATTNFLSTGTTAQTAYMLFRNPNASGVNCKLRKINFYGNGGSFRIYQDPTVTANGTAVTSVGNRQTGQATAQCLVTTLPTVSSNGTVFKSYTVAAQNIRVEEFDFSRWLEPNHFLLVTIAQSGNSAAGSVDIEWAEQP